MGDRHFSFTEVQEYLENIVLNCRNCGVDTDRYSVNVRGYQAESGWTIDGSSYWMYIHCKHCQYDTSFEKLGIQRNTNSRSLTNGDKLRANFYRTRSNEQIVFLHYRRGKDIEKFTKKLDEAERKYALVIAELNRREADGSL